MKLNYLYSPPQAVGRLKAEYADFIVREELGYELAGEGNLWRLKSAKPTPARCLWGKS